jgi:hypothetical protein
MVFKMNRPIIKGTTLHKASIAKAKAKAQAVVAQTRTKADPSLTWAGEQLGKSYIPEAIDFTIDQPKIDIPKDAEKKKIKLGKGWKKIGKFFKNALGDIMDATGNIIGNIKDKKVKEIIKEDTIRDKSGDITVTPIEPRGYKQPEKKREEELKKATGKAPDSGKSTDRFAIAAEKFGYDLSTVEGWEEAEEGMEYNDRTDEWINPKATVESIKKEIQQSEEDKKIDAEVAAITAETARKEQERQVELKAEKKRVADEKLIEKQKNKAIKEQNKIKDAAREYYGPDVKLTQARLNAYNEMMRKQQEALDYAPDIEEEDDPEWWEIEQQEKEAELEKIPSKPQVLPDEPKKYSAGRQIRLDKKYEDAGPNVRANMIEDGYVPKEQREDDSAMNMRDDRIWKNAIKNGTVHENMRKSGYIPRNEL